MRYSFAKIGAIEIAKAKLQVYMQFYTNSQQN